MIILDLEWNRGFDRTPLDEILQIGAVRVERPGGPVLDTFSVCIRPAVHKKFDLGAKGLPELQAARTSKLDFAAAIELFRAWSASETTYAAWGGGDLAALNKSCQFWRVPGFAAERVYNFQTAFSYLLGTDQQIALWRAVDYCGIPDTFTFHNALNDALYTALVGGWLTQEALEYTPPRRAPKAQSKAPKTPLRLSGLPFPKQPRQTVGPFHSAEMVLDAGNSRKPPCPICGRRGCVAQWRFVPPKSDREPRKCFSVFSCPDHGRFLCRLAVARLDSGMWRGRLSVPVVSPEVKREYAAACRSSTHTCKSGARNRRRSYPAGPPGRR